LNLYEYSQFSYVYRDWVYLEVVSLLFTAVKEQKLLYAAVINTRFSQNHQLRIARAISNHPPTGFTWRKQEE